MARASRLLRIELAYSPAPRQVQTAQLELPDGSTLADALRASGWIDQYGLAPDTLNCGVWGRVQPWDAPLRNGDRIEIYRPLKVDPKEARRQRYRKQRRT
jgi:putative ubiquitin-RnfH superfamily antitoxin RatB of RatAB toxin-antitoxin module